MTEPKQKIRKASAPAEVAPPYEPFWDDPDYATPRTGPQSTRQAAIDRMIARKLQASIDGQEEHARLAAYFRTRERAKRILEAVRHAR